MRSGMGRKEALFGLHRIVAEHDEVETERAIEDGRYNNLPPAISFVYHVSPDSVACHLHSFLRSKRMVIRMTRFAVSKS